MITSLPWFTHWIFRNFPISVRKGLSIKVGEHFFSLIPAMSKPDLFTGKLKVISSGVSHSDGSCVLGRIHSDISSNIPKKVYHIVTDNFVNLLHISYAWLYKTECWGRKFHAFSFNSHRNCKIFMTNFNFIFDTICVPYIFRKSIFRWNCDHDTPLCDTPLLGRYATMWYTRRYDICDVIKQNVFTVYQIQFLFFRYIICKATFYNRPIEIGLLVPRYVQLKGCKNNRKQGNYLFCLTIS